MNEERLAKEICEVRVLGKNKVERPQRRWIEQVRQTAEQRDINWNIGPEQKHGREKLDIIEIHDKRLLNERV